MDKILILDFGSQYTQLIARRVREANVYSEIHPCTKTSKEILSFNPKGIILSGGPASVLAKDSPRIPDGLFDLKIPILGICYGLQSIVHTLGGDVEKSIKREYGPAKISAEKTNPLFKNINNWPMDVWMSHGDRANKLPNNFKSVATSENSPFAAISNESGTIFGLQFHPEVAHTPEGYKIISNFLDICGCKRDWTPKHFIEESISKIRNQVKDKKVVLGLSGGVDSSVAALLIHKAIGDKLTCIFVDNGLLRKNEGDKVEDLFHRHFKIPFIRSNSESDFLNALKDVEDPEKKRKIIGNKFIDIFEKEANKIKDVEILAQGTLYPDVIESVSCFGPSVTIKSHHNVGGLPEKMKMTLLEPLRELFKDEVRLVGKELGLSDEVIGRQPFPGPGLAVRILGAITKERCDILREADAILMKEVKEAGLYNKLWQSFCVLLPVQSVGVMGDERTYENVCAIRAVNSTDGMTADWARLPYDLLAQVSSKIINEVRGINRVVYDISSKPPATIEWE